MTDTTIDEQPSHQTTSSKQPVSHRPSNGSILLVEDNDAHALLIQHFLEEQPLVSHLDRIRDGEKALTYLFRHDPYADPPRSPRPALVLLDLSLPKVDGLGVLRQIRASRELSDLPVVILTTSEVEEDVVAAYALRANGYLIKPLDAAQFSGMIEGLVNYWLGCNHLPQRER